MHSLTVAVIKASEKYSLKSIYEKCYQNLLQQRIYFSKRFKPSHRNQNNTHNNFLLTLQNNKQFLIA